MKHILFFLSVFFGLQTFAIDNVEVAKAIKGGAIVVDVRTPFEFRRGHYNGAINIPVEQIPIRYKELGKRDKAIIIVYCRAGQRSETAKNNLKQLGFLNVYNGGGLADMLSNASIVGAK